MQCDKSLVEMKSRGKKLVALVVNTNEFVTGKCNFEVMLSF